MVGGRTAAALWGAASRTCIIHTPNFYVLEYFAVKFILNLIFAQIFIEFVLAKNKKVPVVQLLLSQEMNTVTRVQILDETHCISHSTSTLGKGMNPNILPPAIDK